MANRVLLSIGTKKGLFVAESPKTRRRFTLRGPFGPGVAVYSALIDTRGAPRVYGSSCNAFFGMKVLRSTDLGKTFKETRSEEHTSELQSQSNLVCRLLLEKKKKTKQQTTNNNI